MKVLQIANYIEGVGGIAVQVKLIRDLLHNEHISCDIISTKGSIIKRATAIMKLLFKGKGYDVFHIHACSGMGFFPAVVGIVSGRILKKRTVLTYHGGGANEFFRKRTRIVKFFLNMSDCNIVLSGFIGRVYDKYDIKYIIIPNIIESSCNHHRLKRNIHPKFISTRSLTETYNIECTLKAFTIIKEQYPEAELFILGEGPSKSKLEAYVYNKKISGVKFVGLVDNTHIYDYLDRADIMINSSLFDNMPVSILEGFNAGLLVISSNVGGIPYMIKDKINGLLFESDQPSQLANCIVWALQNQEETFNIIERAYDSLKNYTWDHIKGPLFKAYKG